MTRSGATARASSSTRSGTAGPSTSTSATCRGTRSPGSPPRPLPAGQADAAERQARSHRTAAGGHTRPRPGAAVLLSCTGLRRGQQLAFLPRGAPHRLHAKGPPARLLPTAVPTASKATFTRSTPPPLDLDDDRSPQTRSHCRPQRRLLAHSAFTAPVAERDVRAVHTDYRAVRVLAAHNGTPGKGLPQ